MTSKERRWWVLAALYTLSIYAAAYFVQFLMMALFERGWLSVTLGGLFVAVAAAILALLLRSKPAARELWVLPAALVAYGWLWKQLEIVQERVHLIQYGLLAALLLAALEARRDRLGRGRPFLAALALTALAGWGDEAVQAILPNRTYDLRDVALNAISGGLFLGVVALRRWLRAPGGFEPATRVDSDLP